MYRGRQSTVYKTGGQYKTRHLSKPMHKKSPSFDYVL